MTHTQRLQNLEMPRHPVDVVLDTDAYNEIDDQFAIAYLLRSADKLHLQAIYAAPFHNFHSSGPADGMEKSYLEIFKLLDLMGESAAVCKGSHRFLSDEQTPVESPAARDLVARARTYSPENPLYVVAIGAITNIASALIIDPSIAENMVIVWLGGHAHHYCDTREFNMHQDIAAARVVLGSGAPFVQLPCLGVVSEFTLSKPELEYWLVGKNPLATYLAENTIAEADAYAAGRPWTRVIWDVTAVAWLLGGDGRFMQSDIRPLRRPGYDGHYQSDEELLIRYVYKIHRDSLMQDLIEKLLH